MSSLHPSLPLLLAFSLLGQLPTVAADSITVVNPSFQADDYPVYPGYNGQAGNPAAITGWTGGGGINGSDVGAGSPFGDNGVYPDGTRVAFVQGTGSLTQTLTSFTIGQRYWVQVWTNARNCCGDVPKVGVTINGLSLLGPTALQPVGGASPYYLANFSWLATAASGQLVLSASSNAGGDASAVFDAITVIKRGTTEVLIANPSFEASGTGQAAPGYYPQIAGWEKFGVAQVGINQAAGPFHDNGVVPDGASVLLIQQAGGVQQGIAGLSVGRTYRLILRYNSRAGTAAPTFRASIDGQTAFNGVVAPVGSGQPYRTLTFDFTARTETALLVLENLGVNNDDTVLVDNVSLATLGAAPSPVLAVPQPGVAGAAGGIVTFNELHYNPAGGAPEWVELVNQFSTRIDLSGWRLTNGLDYTFPEGTVIEPGAYLVISSLAGNPAGSLGPFTGHLDGTGETLRLKSKQGWDMDEVTYGVTGDWPTTPDGSGPSLAKRAIALASDTAASWVASAQNGGTPGAVNFLTPQVLAIPGAHVAGSIVINEIFYHAHPTYADGATPYAENPTEWVELHNRSGADVNLAGWQLDDAISYTFPANSTLLAGGFLVVNQTQFSGSLKNSGDSIKLRDAAQNLIDKVRYRERGRWSALADGNGSSLELRDPDADNTQPESWAASDESTKQGWQNYTYDALGAEPPGSNNPANWHECLIGLLDAGEVLIDNVSVREDPFGANLEVLQNGTFEGDTLGQAPSKWRCLGTHKSSVVVTDPLGTGKVLKIVATGEIEHTYNACSTTLVGNQAIDPTKTYRISFRARWLAGSPQLNTRLYLDRAARTTILPQPAVAGTPGVVNSKRVANAGPTITEFVHTPLVPAPSQLVTVYFRPFDPDGLGSQTLFYSVHGAAFVGVPMTNDGTGRFKGNIPAQSLTGRIVQFYVQSSDSLGVTSVFPPGGSTSRALYKVGDGGIATQPVANKLRLIMTAADATAMHNPIHAVSNARWGATLIANDREVFYDVHVRLRSSPYGRQGNRTGWNIDLDPEQPFRGTESDLVLDGAFNQPLGNGGGWVETTLGASINELLYQRLAERVGGIASEHDDVVYLATPYYENRRAQLRLRRYSNAALDDFIPNGGNGSLFKEEIIYYPTTTVDGNPESLKNPYNTFFAVDTLSQGSDKNAYRFNYLPQNHHDRDDFSGILAMTTAFSSSNETLYDQCNAALDLDNWSRVLAFNALTGLADTLNQHLTHNVQFLTRPGDGRVLLLPWDMDHAFYFATNFGLYGGEVHRVKDLIADPRMKRRLAAHLYDFCQTDFTNTYLDPWIDHYNALAGKTYNSNFKNWVTDRRAFVLNQLNTDWPATPFAITTNGGADFATATPVVALQGQAWIDASAVRRTGAAEPLPLTWLSGSTWEVTVPLGAGANTITLEALNARGTVVGVDTIVVTNTGATVPAAAGNFVISELMYRPSNPTPTEITAGFNDPDVFEFLELMNVSTSPLDLTDAAFTVGITYTFPASTLAPGARLLLVRNPAGFASRHPGVTVFGTYTGKLDNGGERLLLLDRGGLPILDFTYNDALPWPVEADGGGYSLTLKNPSSLSNLTLAESWRVSAQTNGSAGLSDALLPANFPNLIDYALTVPPAASLVNGHATFTWTERIGADSVSLTPRLSTNLTTWNADPGDASILVPVSNVVNPNGTRTVSLRSPSLATASAREFFALRIVTQ